VPAECAGVDTAEGEEWIHVAHNNNKKKALGGSLVKTVHYPSNFIKGWHWERLSFSGSTTPRKCDFPGVQELAV